ncbi:MAG: YebC/PmpR family DNA-binding transcriptional regulator [Spirochaetes bacterium]|nr:YebC/PmpR family DNA-binding transcriptional regulator [Spirochaetota bacterium]
MSGHSKWSTIKHKKAATDKKRGQIFTKILKELTISAKLGGGDADSNPRLRTAMLKAKESNIPKDTMERAIKKGTGDMEGVNYEEFIYEGYGPEGVAIYMEIMTDNKNRTASDVRSIMTKSGGNLGANGCVAYIFNKKGVIIFDNKIITEDKAMEIGIDAGIEDITSDENHVEIYTKPDDFESVLKAFDDTEIPHLSAEITMVPNTYQDVPADKIDKILNLIDRLEDLDDVQNVYSNLNIPDDYNVE